MFIIRNSKIKRENSLKERLRELEELLEKYYDNYPLKQKIQEEIQRTLELLKLK
ncbi:MAG: hypothetical protein QXO70_04425 [Candidatus Pacearchaeota archaeon]